MIPLFLDHNKKNVYHVQEIINLEGKQYEIQDRIASGGNAVVHKCTEFISGEEYAIKFQLALNRNRYKRFIQEIELSKGLDHSQLMSCLASGRIKAIINNETKAVPYFIMPLAQTNLRDYLHEMNGIIRFEEYIAQFKGLSEALAELHTKAIHRDIKPENILVMGEKWILSDLGLCQFVDKKKRLGLSNENEMIGPRYWMSPEAINSGLGKGDEISKSSDVYQLCSVFWYIVNNKHPTGILTREDWGGPDKIFEPIYRSLSHNPLNRPRDGREFFNALIRAINS